MPVNMAHCRFRNTLAALRECADSLENTGAFASPEPFAALARDEREAARELVAACREFAADYGRG